MGHAGIFRELHAVIVPVSDMARSRTWYETVLGLEPVKAEPAGWLTVYRTGPASHLCLYVPAPNGEKPGYREAGAFPNFRADDIEVVHRHLKQHGVRCADVQAGPPLRFFTCYDPDGNRIDVCEYDARWLP